MEHTVSVSHSVAMGQQSGKFQTADPIVHNIIVSQEAARVHPVSVTQNITLAANTVFSEAGHPVTHGIVVTAEANINIVLTNDVENQLVITCYATAYNTRWRESGTMGPDTEFILGYGMSLEGQTVSSLAALSEDFLPRLDP